MSGGIPCPACGCKHHRTRNTERIKGRIRRRRVCRNCGKKFVTYERHRDEPERGGGDHSGIIRPSGENPNA